MLIGTAYGSEKINSDDTIALVEVDSTQPLQQDAESSWKTIGTNMVPMVLIFVVLYFFLLRPQEKKRQQQETLISSVKKGEQVLTASGIYGIVVKVNDDGSLEIEVAKDTVVKMRKDAIVDIVSRKIDSKAKKITSDTKENKKSVKKPV